MGDLEQSLTRDLGVLFWKMKGRGWMLSKPRMLTCDHLSPDCPLPHLELRLRSRPSVSWPLIAPAQAIALRTLEQRKWTPPGQQDRGLL